MSFRSLAPAVLLLVIGSLPVKAQSPPLASEPVPLATLPERPRPILELGSDFLGSGPIARGMTLATGATWQPSLLVWGQTRTALQ